MYCISHAIFNPLPCLVQMQFASVTRKVYKIVNVTGFIVLITDKHHFRYLDRLLLFFYFLFLVGGGFLT